MLVTRRQFFFGRTRGILQVLRENGLGGLRIKARLFWHALGNPGMARRMAGVLAAYFLPGFHPWKHDDRA